MLTYVNIKNIEKYFFKILTLNLKIINYFYLGKKHTSIVLITELKIYIIVHFCYSVICMPIVQIKFVEFKSHLM